MEKVPKQLLMPEDAQVMGEIPSLLARIEKIRNSDQQAPWSECVTMYDIAKLAGNRNLQNKWCIIEWLLHATQERLQNLIIQPMN